MVVDEQADIKLTHRSSGNPGAEAELRSAAAQSSNSRTRKTHLPKQQGPPVALECGEVDLRPWNRLIVGIELRSSAAEESVRSTEIIHRSIVVERLPQTATPTQNLRSTRVGGHVRQ